ncbi:TIGR00341 family protein [Putridiphycobacter roseus]|uniref:TIGR00341 family protein n=1 Tax=Putridiphycobacter roseus TaxID=2219161 RepID=A0A2W1NQC6_9FLAO|nr:TIGR00341 family protein [Putridiphycobacter roseus]PZE16838.1 TIGR00341 family protein [Putridiphycobacter roseus]
MENSYPEDDIVDKKYQGGIKEDPTKFHFEKKPINLLSNILEFFKSIFSIKEDLVSYAEVVKETRDGVAIAGYNVWILMCSIAIASVGLNVNSTAVIVGAMLISPLMGPIRGIGFSVGINDFTLLVRSLKNLGITVGVSLGVSFLYFLISPIDTITEQLFIRTEPTFLDVVVAFVGGLAGVIAVVKGKKDTVIPGVAIATALMPPLCTAGYGLAVGNFNYFLGASYLFLINSVLIALSTLLIVRYFNFPKREYLDPSIERKVKTYIIIFMVVVIAPSGYLFYKMTKRIIFENNALEFVNNVIVPSTKGKVSSTIVYHSDSAYIDIMIQGDIIDAKTRSTWLAQKGNYNIQDASLNLFQGGDYKTFVDEKLKDILASTGGNKELVALIMEKDQKLSTLQLQLDAVEKNKAKNQLNLKEVIQDFKIDYPECAQININQAFSVNNAGDLDTNYTIAIQFNSAISKKEKLSLQSKLSQKLKLKLAQRNYNKQDSIPVYIFQ